MKMNYASVILVVLGVLYKAMRPILLKAIDDPEAEWDNRLMAAADSLFGYSD
jgi:hypothetical protein